MTGFVDSSGLSLNPDNLHFSASALREFGLRYFKVFKSIENKNKVFIEKSSPDDAIRSSLDFFNLWQQALGDLSEFQ